MDVGLLFLHAVLTLWLVHGLWLAVVGFCVLAGRKLRDGFAARAAGAATWRNPVRRAETRSRTAITIPVYNEDSVRVFSGMGAMPDWLDGRPEEHKSDIQSPMRTSHAVF